MRENFQEKFWNRSHVGQTEKQKVKYEEGEIGMEEDYTGK